MAMTVEAQTMMFGCMIQDIRDLISQSCTDAHHIALSLLSDAQEQMLHGAMLEARQTINRAKFIISTYTVSV
jgi:hypothetical protein